MPKLVFTIFLSITYLTLSGTSLASCPAPQPIAEATKRSHLIFVGTVMKITPGEIAYASRVGGRGLKWEKRFFKTAIATLEVVKGFKGVNVETVDVATSVDGDAGYKFDGGTWLKAGKTYLVYAEKRRLEGTVDDDWEGYSKAVAEELRQIQRSVPKDLAAEVNEINSKISPYSSSVCGRTALVEDSAAELEQLQKMFPPKSAKAMERDVTLLEFMDFPTYVSMDTRMWVPQLGLLLSSYSYESFQDTHIVDHSGIRICPSRRRAYRS